MNTFLRSLPLAAIAGVALLLLTLTGCSQTEIVPKDVTSGKGIRFQPVTEKAMNTRASVTTYNNMNDFRVVASTVGASDFDYIENFLFDRVIVSKNDDNTWSYYPIVLWPSAATEGSFFAWSPARSPHATFASHPTEGLGDYMIAGDPYLHYEVPDDITATGMQLQEDLLVARQYDLAATEPTVAFQFQHALSRVVFRARSEMPNMNFYIKEVQLCNVYSEGYLYMNDSNIPESGPFEYTEPYGEPYFDGMWGDLETRKDYTVSLPGGSVYIPYATAVPGAFTSLHASTNALMVLPQTTTYYGTKITESATKPAADKLLVKVTYNAAGSTVADKVVFLNVCKPGTIDQDFVFEMGRQYNFDITLTDVGITYDVAVVNWDVTVNPWDTDAPDVPVPAQLLFKVGDQFDQGGKRGVVSEIDAFGRATKIYQIVPLPENPGELNFTAASNWCDLDMDTWNAQWNRQATTAVQQAFSTVWKPEEAAKYTIEDKSAIISLMNELEYKEVATRDLLVSASASMGTWMTRDLYDTSWEEAENVLFIDTVELTSTTLTSVNIYHYARQLEEIGILVITELPLPVYKEQ
jgi:hypothetical protein